ncbi:MAG TPA: hypothetical protein VKY29_07535 [Cryomorphaceae bacterium]|nr:hypothetical protein [Cryomorphaceae bacterium]
MAKTKTSEERVRMLNGAIAYLRYKGYHEIKAPLKAFPDPQAVFQKASDAGFVPDIIAEKDFGTYVFEIVEPGMMDNLEERFPMWEVFEEYAKRKGGKFYLFAYVSDAEALSEKLEGLELQAGVIKISN